MLYYKCWKQDQSFQQIKLYFVMVDLPKRSHFLFEMLKSIEIISHSSEKRNVLSTLQGMFSLTNKIKPPPNLFRSLRNILYPFTWNCWSGKESSNLVSKIKQISASLRTSSLKSKNLFLNEFILRWPIISIFQTLLMEIIHGVIISHRRLS